MTEVAKQIETKDAVNQIGLKDLFVINLCASMTPMPDVPKQLKGYEKHTLYQISKMEDGRRRYRLRLGFFSNETDAELLVASIRMMYPAALVTCALSDDLRYVSADTPMPVAPRDIPVTPSAAAPVVAAAPVAAPVPVAAPAPVAATPAPAPTAAPAKMPAAAAPKAEPVKAKPEPTIAKAPAAPAPAALELIDPPAPVATPVPTTDTQIFHVGRGISIPESSLELTADDLRVPTAATMPAQAAAPATKVETKQPTQPTTTAARPSQPAAQATKPVSQPSPPAAPVAKASTPAPVAAKPTATPPAPAVAPKPPTTANGPIMAATVQLPANAKKDDYIPVLDTTLTIRTLTKSEAEDPNRPKWFVVQLAHSERPIDISTMPKLDIFSAYSLYAVALMEQGGIRHTLRLGFFKESVSAEAVMGYLKTFFNNPAVVQISAAEHDRFSEGLPKKPTATVEAPAEPQRSAPVKVVPMAQPATKPATKPAGPAKAPVSLLRAESSKQGSFLSRLIGKQLD